ncbi:unnamed protein product [Natator depressus]
MHFKARANLHNIRVSGKAASADEEAAHAFPDTLAKIIEKGGYCACQVFNIDETGLFWKRMLSRAYITKEEKSMLGLKAGKDRLTLLLSVNTEGDFKLKLTNEDLTELEKQKVAEEEDAPIAETPASKVLKQKCWLRHFNIWKLPCPCLRDMSPTFNLVHLRIGAYPTYTTATEKFTRRRGEHLSKLP